jgi:hypothetical protein
MLFKALQVLAFLFFIALLAIAPEAKDGKVDSKAEFLVTMTWPDPHPDDFDMFFQDPLGNMVWYRRREASAYYCVAFFHVEGLPGWSATAPLPPQFQLLWARVVEPNPLDRDPGAVHIWVEDLDAANLPSGQPRAYRLPYSAALAAKVEAARDEIMKGHPQGGRAADFGAGNGQPRPKVRPMSRRFVTQPRRAAIRPAAVRSIYRS